MELLREDFPGEVLDGFDQKEPEVIFVEEIAGRPYLHYYVTEERFIEIATAAGHEHRHAAGVFNWMQRTENHNSLKIPLSERYRSYGSVWPGGIYQIPDGRKKLAYVDLQAMADVANYHAEVDLKNFRSPYGRKDSDVMMMTFEKAEVLETMADYYDFCKEAALASQGE